MYINDLLNFLYDEIVKSKAKCCKLKFVFLNLN